MKTRRSRYEERSMDFAFAVHPYGNPEIPVLVPTPPKADPATMIEWNDESWMLPRASQARLLVPAMQANCDVIGKIRELGGWRVYPVERGGRTV